MIKIDWVKFLWSENFVIFGLFIQKYTRLRGALPSIVTYKIQWVWEWESQDWPITPPWHRCFKRHNDVVIV